MAGLHFGLGINFWVRVCEAPVHAEPLGKSERLHTFATYGGWL